MDTLTSQDKDRGKHAFEHAAHPDAHLFRYRNYVDDFDLDKEQKIELLQTVYKIVENFVDRAFKQDSVQKVLDNKPLDSAQKPHKLVK